MTLAQQFAQTGKVETPEEKNKKVEAVTVDDVQRVAQSIFKNKSLNLAIVGPHRKEQKEISETLKF